MHIKSANQNDKFSDHALHKWDADYQANHSLIKSLSNISDKNSIRVLQLPQSRVRTIQRYDSTRIQPFLSATLPELPPRFTRYTIPGINNVRGQGAVATIDWHSREYRVGVRLQLRSRRRPLVSPNARRFSFPSRDAGRAPKLAIPRAALPRDPFHFHSPILPSTVYASPRDSPAGPLLCISMHTSPSPPAHNTKIYTNPPWNSGEGFLISSETPAVTGNRPTTYVPRFHK